MAADSPYFDRTYFDSTYFDTDRVSAHGAQKAVIRPLILPPDPLIELDDELLALD